MNKQRAHGFTLAELLVAMAVLSILAAMLFPVFKAAIDAAKRTHCLANFRQIGAAVAMYMSDYDEVVPPVNYRDARVQDPQEDRTWVQTLLPYVGHFGPFRCPSDTGRDSGIEVHQEPDGPIGDDAWNRYYRASLRSNLGYNYLNFSPLVQFHDGRWEAFPVRGSAVGNPSGTIMFIDSLWDRTRAGLPYGGGSWVVVPPCRYASSPGGAPRDTFRIPPGAAFYFGFQPEGWQPESETSWLVYGGAWPWHRGRFNVLYADGRAKNAAYTDLIRGCNFKSEWEGFILNLEQYQWDLEQ